jgi:hypothetical protein
LLTFVVSGSFAKTDRFLASVGKLDISSILKTYGERGVDALRNATPVDTGLTADSWGYEVAKTSSGWSITWTNTHVIDGVPIAVILQYGHGTGTGGYIQGRDYINPAIQPIFDEIVTGAWKEVTSA